MNTNFNRLTTEELTVWSRDTWKVARLMDPFGPLVGTSKDSMIQRITELKRTEKGARAVITLVPDLEGDGVVGDNQLEGFEEEIKAYDRVIEIDQIRNANRNKGKMTDQRTVVSFREQSRDVLAYWLSDIIVQIRMQALAGYPLTLKPNGTTRVGSQLPLAAFAPGIQPPTANRVRNWEGTSPTVLAAGNTSSTTMQNPSWEMLVNAKAYAKTNRIRPVRGVLGSGVEMYVVLMHTQALAKLKLDSQFLSVYKEGLPRSPDHPLLKGTGRYYVDGLMIMEHEHVPHANTWGAGAVQGATTLICGAQALGFADIGSPEWNEKGFDYDNQQGIAVGKILGVLKPVFRSAITSTEEDFGVLRINHLR